MSEKFHLSKEGAEKLSLYVTQFRHIADKMEKLLLEEHTTDKENGKTEES